MLLKVLVGDVFMHYFQNMSPASGLFAPNPPNLSTPEKDTRLC